MLLYRNHCWDLNETVSYLLLDPPPEDLVEGLAEGDAPLEGELGLLY